MYHKYPSNVVHRRVS